MRGSGRYLLMSPQAARGRAGSNGSGEQLFELGDRVVIGLVRRNGAGEIAATTEQQDGRRMLHLLAHRRVRHWLGIDAVLLLDAVDLRRRAGEPDDRRVEQLGILADLLGS